VTTFCETIENEFAKALPQGKVYHKMMHFPIAERQPGGQEDRDIGWFRLEAHRLIQGKRCPVFLLYAFWPARPQFFLAKIARRVGRWMRNPGGKEFSRAHRVRFRKGRGVRRTAEKPRLKPASSREEPPPWSPKEWPSPLGRGSHKTGGGQNCFSP